MIRKLFVIALLGLGVVQAQNAPKPGEVTNLDDLIDTLFAKDGDAQIVPTTEPPAPEPLPPGVPEENICTTGECIPYYQCNNNEFVTDGEGMIDIRFDKTVPRLCHDYLESCCGQDDIIPETVQVVPFTVKENRCGQRNLLGVTVRVSGDDNVSEYGEFPWMAAILQEQIVQDKPQNVYQCGGSLIHPNVLLTAAHCVAEKPPNTLRVRLGEWDTQTQSEQIPHQDRQAVEVVIHPEYRKGPLFNDIALVFLNEPVELGETIQTICLPPQNTVFDHSRCTASGWGKNQFGRNGTYQVILKKIEVPVVPRATCQTQLRTTRLSRRFILHKSFLCAGGERGKDTCRGDGGSPLICPVMGTQNRYYQSGIVAWGIGCGENQIPGVYANVAQFKNWIDGIFTQRGLDNSFYTYQ